MIGGDSRLYIPSPQGEDLEKLKRVKALNLSSIYSNVTGQAVGAMAG